MTNKMKNVIITHFDRYNERRYSKPWVCTMTEIGKFDFEKEVGAYTGEPGQDGDLIVFQPAEDQIYGWGQKDYRGKNTIKKFCKWNGDKFVECDRFGTEKIGGQNEN